MVRVAAVLLLAVWEPPELAEVFQVRPAEELGRG